MPGGRCCTASYTFISANTHNTNPVPQQKKVGKISAKEKSKRQDKRQIAYLPTPPHP